MLRLSEALSRLLQIISILPLAGMSFVTGELIFVNKDEDDWS